MYCTKCGVVLGEKARFCSECGCPTARNTFAGRSDFAQGYPKLSRPREDRKIAGVCAGFAKYFEVDVVLMRVLWLGIALCTGVGFLAYLAAWIVIPADYGYETRTVVVHVPQTS